MVEKHTPKPEIIDPDSVTLSAEDHERIKRKAASLVAKERKEALEDQALKAALEELRGKEGLRSGDPVEDELVDYTINLGESTDRTVVNGRPYFHGQTVTVPRHVARSLMETCYRTQLHEHSITDKPLSAFLQRKRETEVSRRKGIINAPRRPDEGSPLAGAA